MGWRYRGFRALSSRASLDVDVSGIYTGTEELLMVLGYGLRTRQ